MSKVVNLFLIFSKLYRQVNLKNLDQDLLKGYSTQKTNLGGLSMMQNMMNMGAFS